MKTVQCKQCDGKMKKTTRTIHNRGAQLLAVILFFAGIALLFFVPIGTIIGLVIMIGSARIGYKKEKIWKCESCDSFFERA